MSMLADSPYGIAVPPRKKPLASTQPALSTPPATPNAAPSAVAAAPGTVAGSYLRRGTQGAINTGIAGVNTADQAVTDLTNAGSAPARAGAGFVRDFFNAAAGNPASPDAGKPIAGINAPAPMATVDFSKADSATSGYGGGPPSDAAPAPALNRPFNQDAAQLRFDGAAPLVPGAGAPAATPAASAASANPGIDSGVTLPSGRHVAYGAMVNGVPTFSDGSGAKPGTLGAIPRTMTDQDIANLGARLPIVPAQTGTLASDALGYTPSSAQMVNTLVRNAQNPGGRFGVSQAMNDASDLASATNGDWRSPLGIAASNAAMDATGATSALQRKSALENLNNLQDTAAKNLLTDNAGANELQRTALTNQGALDDETLRGQYGLADTAAKAAADLAASKPDQVTLGDGTLGLLHRNGQVQLATGADGKPVKVATTKTGQLDEKDIVDASQKLLPQVLGLDPVTGMIRDPTNPNGPGRAPTTAELTEGMRRARQIVTGQGAAPPQKPTLQQFLGAARARNPGVSDADLTTYYNKNYGS